MADSGGSEGAGSTEGSVPHDVVYGYHGTSTTVAASLVAGSPFTASRNGYDWLGDGVYFWVDGPGRAWQWAEDVYGKDAAVVCARVKLGNCLDLCDTQWTSVLKVAHKMLATSYLEIGKTLPENRGRAAYLDCLVINYVATEIASEIDTVRAPFLEGERLYDGSAFYEQSHVQVCVRNLQTILTPVTLHRRR